MRKPNDLTDEIKVLPVAVIHSAGETKPTPEALRDGGIPAAEITFRPPPARRKPSASAVKPSRICTSARGR